MDIAYFHIVLNHLPIIGVPFGLVLLLIGIFAKNDSIKRVALLSFVILGILTIPVYLTGRGGEEFVEDVAGVSEAAIEDHERMATFALISVSVLAAFSLFAFLKYRGLSLFRRRVYDESRLLDGEVSENSISAIPGWVALIALMLALASSGILGYTGKLGGKIRHTEFYGGAQTQENEENEENEEKDKNRADKNDKKINRENPTVKSNSANQITQPAEEAEEKDESGKNRRGRRNGER